MRDRRIFILLALTLVPSPAHARTRAGGTYSATAYSTKGETASGDQTHRHVAAADPALLPLGSRIRITGAGRYSGEYEIEDTGGKIRGRRLDLFIPNAAEAKRFGRRPVRVRVLHRAVINK